MKQIIILLISLISTTCFAGGRIEQLHRGRGCVLDVGRKGFSNNTIALDTSVEGNDGTVSGGCVWSNGVAAYYFDGVDGFVDLGILSSIDQPFSISLWVSFNDYDGYAIAGEERILVSGPNTIIMDTDDGIRLYCGVSLVANTGELTDNQWYYFVFIANGASSKIYLDGVEIASGNSGNNDLNATESSWLAITGPPYNQRPFNGKIGNIMIYDHSLSVTEIWQLYQERKYKHR